MKTSDIDFVMMWVDGSDPEWLKEKSKYEVKSNADDAIYRSRDWGLLQYWFRGVEKFCPWVRKIHFITWGPVPDWLDTSNPKLNIVKHSDYIPEKYLPTFNSITIEDNLHRIKDLSEKFVLFNDDFYILKNIKETDFFDNGVPMDTVALNVHCPLKNPPIYYILLNDTAIINEHFNMKESIKANRSKWFNLKNGPLMLRTLVLKTCPRFPGFWQHHLGTALLKSTLEEVWKEEPDILDQTCSHKFRESTDVNQWLFREWQIAKGNFKNRSYKFGKPYFIDRDGIQSELPKMVDYISKQRGSIIAINDGPMTDEEFKNTVEQIKTSFDKILPEKSSFEK